MKPLTGKQLCRLLEREGRTLLCITGSHQVYGIAPQRGSLSQTPALYDRLKGVLAVGPVDSFLLA